MSPTQISVPHADFSSRLDEPSSTRRSRGGSLASDRLAEHGAGVLGGWGFLGAGVVAEAAWGLQEDGGRVRAASWAN